MAHSIKWLTDNLGITRDMIRHYENEKLLTKNPKGKTRDYNDEEVERIWCIKLLIGIGFTTKEIYSMMHEPDFDFYLLLTDKVADLERKQKDATISLQVAKSIKFLGKVPTVSELGSVRFEDFLAHVRKNWNFYDDPKAVPYLQIAETFLENDPIEWSTEQIDRIIDLLGQTDLSDMLHTCKLSTYYQLIVEMKQHGYMDEVVQRVVQLLHEYLIKHNEDPKLDGKITPQFLAKYMAPIFVEGDIAAMNERNYGKEGCMFIAQAIAYYGGYEIGEL